MPIKSEKQHRAMWAAESGHSTLGIPRDVAEKFLAGDAEPVKGHAAGVVHVARDGSVLLLKRGGEEGVDNYVGHWALPGGGANEGEAPAAAAHRETLEETGFDGRGPLKLLDQVRTPNNMAYHLFARPVQKFTPKLNAEHTDHAWANLDDLPQPLHPAVEKQLQKIGSGRELFDWCCADGDLAQDSVHEACGGRGCAGCGGSGVSPITYAPMKPGLANDELGPMLLEEIGRQMGFDRGSEYAFDRAPDGAEFERAGVVVTLAFDREEAKRDKQVKSEDAFERLHVKRVPITKACVSPYYGREIPKAKQLGLDPNKVYYLLRDPAEIRKAAPTFHNIPLLSLHRPHTPDAHDGDITVGTVGENAQFEHPYLYNNLSIWSREGLHYAEGDQKELSSSYSYDADMTPGVFEGQRYDGVMRNMKGNHVCMVKKGRAGSDVALDEALKPENEEFEMSALKMKSLKASVAYGAVRAHLTPLLAQDSALPPIHKLFAAVKPGGFTRPAIKTIGAGIRVGLKNVKLAQDADLAGVVKGVEQLMSSIEGDKSVKDAAIGEEVEPSDMEDPSTGEADPNGGADDGGLEAVAAYLKEKGVPDDVIAGMPGMAGGGAVDNDGPTDVMAKRLAKGAAKDKDTVETEEGPDGKEKKEFAMDEDTFNKRLAQERTATMATMRAIEAAKNHVRPRVGEINLAFDSAAQVYHKAFEMRGNKTAKKITDVDALSSMWDMLPAPGKNEPLAQDGAVDDDGADDFSKRFPNASRVRKAG